jgi:hypothetical protein
VALFSKSKHVTVLETTAAAARAEAGGAGVVSAASATTTPVATGDVRAVDNPPKYARRYASLGGPTDDARWKQLRAFYGMAAEEEDEAEGQADTHGEREAATSVKRARTGLRVKPNVLLWEYQANARDDREPIGLVRATEAATRVLRATAPDGAVEGGGLTAGRVSVRTSTRARYGLDAPR